jgi:two-component system, OmpR family, copper resistance phosphate regulon response regulator CusR
VKLLVVEDEERIASFLVKGLTAAGYAVEHAARGSEALERIDRGGFALVILDLRLPDLDGLDVLRRLRERDDATPVIVLTARAGVDDRVEGLELGADDYMPKPFAFDELLARVRARLRSTAREAAALEAGGIRLDLRTHRAEAGGREIDLSAREFALLETFLRHPGQVLSREQLLSQVWGFDFDPGSNLVDVYVGYLRRKLGDDALETVRRVGYRLVAERREL